MKKIILLGLIVPNVLAAQLNSSYSNYRPLDKNFVLAANIDTCDTDRRYQKFINKYEHGIRDSAFLRRLVLMSIRQKKLEYSSAIGNAFVSQLKEPLTKSNLNIINYITRSSNDSGFSIFLNNRALVNRLLGARKAESKILSIINEEEILPFSNDKTRQPNWDSIQTVVTQKYGVLGNRFCLGRRIIYYWKVSQDWSNLGKYYKQYFENYYNTSEINTNNVTWQVFLHVNDQEILKFATQIAKDNFENFDKTAEAADTYANLLYKTGKLSKAIKWQQKAIELSNNDKTYLDTMLKMKKGEPTW